jgi:hypothetical protein
VNEANVREAASLLVPHSELGVPVPAYGGRSLPNVASSAVRALGVEVSGAPELLPALANDLDPFRGRRAEGPIVVLLVDGLGWGGPAGLGADPHDVPIGWRERMRPITTVFPTTTTVALTSLSTAEPASRHGVVGHRLFLPSFGSVVELLRMSPIGVAAPDALAGPDWTPAVVSGVPTVFRRGVPGEALTRERFAPQGFTRLVYDGAGFTGYNTAADFAHLLRELLRRPSPPPLIFAYWDELDAVQHLRGPRAEFAGFEAGQVARILAAAVRDLDPSRARGTTVLLTSDHGQVTTNRASEVAIDREPTILPHLAHPPTGDRRAGFFAARPGHADALAGALEDRLPPGHRILPMDRAIDAGLFGPPPFHPELAARLGDLLVLVPSPAGITYRVPGSPPHARYLAGAHGGLDPAELLVPLVVGSLAELGAAGPGP